MLRYVVMVPVLLGFGMSLQAQDTNSRLQADSLRRVLECPADVDWPELPTEGRQVFRSMRLDSAGVASPADPAAAARPDVEVPQYAYYFDAFYGRCMAVIIVQAEGRSLGWVGVSAPPPALGGANEEFFDLLGTQPPDDGSP